MTVYRGYAVATAAIVVPAAMFVGVTGPSTALFSQYLGGLALVAMALSHVIATRARFVELVFGPLDRAYVLHKWLGIIAMIGILLHDSISAEIKALGPETKISDFAETMGEQSLNGLLILVAISLITIIPYRIWYWTHRAMGGCFVLGAIHYVLILKPFSLYDPLGLYVLGFCVAGIASYAYTLTPRTWRRGHSYRVDKIEKSGNASVITMKPISRSMHHKPGQFAFFSFDSKELSATHPFSISSAPRQDGSIRISVAALGDYTAKLARSLQVGAKVSIHGPYGRFSPTKGRKHQVWIAGGIGITPFLSTLEALERDSPQIDLFYTFRGKENAPHLKDIETLAAKFDRVTLHQTDTSTEPRLTPEFILSAINGKAPRVSFCGPSSLREGIKSKLGIRSFHYEAFEIRTGLPVPYSFLRGIYTFVKRSWKFQKFWAVSWIPRRNSP